jgi:2-iminobutanoate/2-iminopropanoate deaminase
MEVEGDKMQQRKFITQGDGLPQWSSPVSHAVVVNNMCFVSGQLSINEQGEYIEGTVDEEANRAFANVFSALTAAGFAKDQIVYMNIVNKIYGDLFSANKRPARTIYQASALPFGGKVKIVATAVKD